MKPQQHIRSAFKPLLYPAFRNLWVATFISNIGTWMQSISAAWIMTSLTSSSLLVASLQAASALPTVFFSIPAGVLADTIDRRRFMLWVQIAMSLIAMTLAVLYFANMLTPLLLLGFTFAIGVGTALTAPAWFATTPTLVPPEHLPEAITLNGIGMNSARAIGPAVAGIIISVYSPGLAFALNAVSFLAFIFALLHWKPERQPSLLPAERFMSGLKAGLRYVRQSRHIHSIFAHAGGFFLCASSLWALLPLIARHELNLSATEYGIMLTSLGVGAVTAAFLLPAIRRAFSRNHMMLLASLLYAAGLGALSSVQVLWQANSALFLCGIAWIAGVSSLHVTAQTSAAAWVRGRVLSIYLVILFGGMGFGSLFWGHIAAIAGVPHALLYSAITLTLSALLLKRIPLPAIESTDLEPSAHWGELMADADTLQHESPVMITVDYHIAPEDSAAFLQEARQLETLRRRDGAILWGVCQSVEQPLHFMEYFMVESWLEHLRQHTRVTQADKRMQDKVRTFHIGAEPPKVSHLLIKLS